MEILPDLAALIAKLSDVVFNKSLSFDKDLYFKLRDEHNANDIHVPYNIYYGKNHNLYKLVTWAPKSKGDKYVFNKVDYDKIGSVILITNGVGFC